MRKLFLLFALIPCTLAAQDGYDRTVLNLNEAGTVWASSSNAAGLAFFPYGRFNSLDVHYAWEGGEYRPMQTGTDVSDLQFDTQGALQTGKVQVWGRFRYNNFSDKGASFNTLLYNPFDERFLYTAADTVAGAWKKQSYEMQFKAAMPLGDHFAAGLHVLYTDRIAAGQIDPRAESYNYSVNVRPAVIWKSGRSAIGLNGLYSNTFERATPSISNSQEIQKVFLLKGLGNWVGEQVGGSGLGTMYFRCNTWGGALQYAYEGSWRLFSELSWARHATRITESPTQPKPHGNTVMNEFAFSAQARHQDGGHLHTISAEGTLSLTKGIEPTVMWNTAEGRWDVKAELEQCLMRTSSASLSYHFYLLEGAHYKTHLFARLGLEDKADTYSTPASVFAYDNILASLGAEKRFALGGGSLLLGLSLEGAKNVQADYSYTGHRIGNAPVRVLYPHNLAVFAADRIRGSLDAEYAFPLSEDTSLAFCVMGSGIAAACGEYGTLGRVSASGAVKLYF